MPTITVKDGLEFFYTDSGAPSGSDNYKIVIIIHGLIFHSGVFQKLLPISPSHSIRTICVNRREYPGTTPLSTEELRVFNSGTEEERAKLIQQFGLDLCAFIAALVKQCDLPNNIAIVAWSMGNIFLIALLACINDLPEDIKKTLQTSVTNIVLWDPPSHALGITSPPGSYVPLWDDDLPPEARAPAFGVWSASYWKHGDISTHDIKELNYRNAGKDKKPSTDNMGPAILDVAEFGVGDKCETKLVAPDFKTVLEKQTDIGLFDPAVREAWSGASFTHMFGDANTWNIIYSNWILEAKVKAAGGSAPIKFRVLEGANHYLMWDEPEVAIKEIKASM